MKKYFFLMFMSFVLVLAGCSESEELDTTSDKIEQNEKNANNQDDEETKVTNRKTIELTSSDDEKIGSAVLRQVDNSVEISLKVEGLDPGKHGVHFHETAACDAPDFESAGGHFNPDSSEHGLENENGPHAGDLPNVDVAEDGTGELEFATEHVSLLADEKNTLMDDDGSALVIHEKEDDGKSDPSGESGDRIACGPLE